MIEVEPVTLLTPGPPRTERRGWPRHAARPDACAPLCSDVGGPAVNVLTIDLSAGGIGLLALRRLDVGTRLSGRLLVRPGQVFCTRMLHVIHARQLPCGAWRVGCQFARPLSRAELRALLGWGP